MKNPAPPFAHDYLVAVRGLLIPAGVWIKGHVATDKRGQPTGYWDERACHFSLDGALYRVSYITNRPITGVYGYVKHTIHPKGITPVSSWNDATQTTHGAVIRLLNTCIINLGGEAYDLIASLGEQDE
jgi:hypothetical protein